LIKFSGVVFFGLPIMIKVKNFSGKHSLSFY